MRNFSGPILNEQLKKFGSYLRFDNFLKTPDVFTGDKGFSLSKEFYKKNTPFQKTLTLSSPKRN